MSEERRRRWVVLSMAAALPLAIVVGVASGSVPISLSTLMRAPLVALGLALPAADEGGRAAEVILWTLRLPRVLLAAVVGGGLAVVGAALQSVFRNPMADSGLLGVGSGAALGAIIAVKLGWASEVFFALPLLAFAGALSASVLVYALAHAWGRPTLSGLLLTGIAVAALATAGTSILLVATDEYRVKVVLFWLAGGLEGRSWVHFRAGALLILAGVLGLLALSRVLDLLSLGEDEAAALGLRVHAARLAVLAVSAVVAGAATSVAGSVPFVGLVAPHALRPLVGSRGRHLLPAAFLAGALLVVLADLAARTVSGRIDLPLGALTAFVGAPYFLIALKGAEGRA